MFNDSDAIAIKALGVGGVFVIELGEIVPDYFFAIVLTPGFGDAAVGFADEPLGMFAGDCRIDRAMIDDEIDHDFQAG